MKQCEKCGDVIPYGKLCYSCRTYLRKGGIWHKPPEIGKVEYDASGKPICHVCGMAYDKLIEHTLRKHGLDTMAYRQTYGLLFSARLTGPGYREKMQKMHPYIKRMSRILNSMRAKKYSL